MGCNDDDCSFAVLINTLYVMKFNTLTIYWRKLERFKKVSSKDIKLAGKLIVVSYSDK